MDVKKLSDKISVASQIQLSDMEALAKAGFSMIISNRPDGEEGGQPTFSEIKEAAEKAGMGAIHVPVVSGNLQADDPAKMGAALDKSEGSVLAFCRSGTRSSMLWALDQGARGVSSDEVLTATSAAGYDLSGLAQTIDKFAREAK